MKRKWLTIIAVLIIVFLAGSAAYAAGNGIMGEGTGLLAMPDTGENSEPVDPEQPTTAAPADSGESTEAPSTEAPATETPSSETPTTETPSTEEPSTEQPPVTEQPTTEQPSDGKANGGTSFPVATKTDADIIEVTTVVTEGGSVIFDTQAIIDLKAQLELTQKDKVEIQQLINELMESQNDFISEMHQIDEIIIEYQDRIDELEEKQAIARSTVYELNLQLEEAEAEAEEQYDMLKEHIRVDYENGRYTYIDALFNAIDFSSVVNEIEYIQAVEKYDQQLLSDFEDKRRTIANKKLLLETLDEDIEMLQQSYNDEQEILELLSEAKESKIHTYQNKIDEAEEALSTIEQLEQQMDASLLRLEQEYRMKLQLSTSRIVVYTGGTFSWPMPVSTTITSPFGYRVAPISGASSYHRGVDIACPTGSYVVAPADGVVIYTGYMGSGGNCVMVDHGSGITSINYHLSGYNCKPGDVVSAGQVIAFSGNTGVTTGPHLHFAVRVNGEYVDPMQFF